MALLKQLIGRLRALLFTRRAERELDREIAAHLVLLEDGFKARGMSNEEARMAARRTLGGIDQTKERHRDTRSFAWLEDLRRDVPYALRGLLRAPGFTLAAGVTLALGIGATTVVATLVNTILVAPLPFANSERLVRIIQQLPASTSRSAQRRPFTRDQLLEWQARTQTLESMAGVQLAPQTVMPTPRGAIRLSGAFVSRDYFNYFDRPALIGRTLLPEDETSNPDVVVFTYAAWQRHLAGNPDILGTSVTLRSNEFDGRPFTIVGIMPPDFSDTATSTSDFWAPLAPRATRPDAPIFLPYVLGLLKPGVSMAAAREEANTIGVAVTPPPADGARAVQRFEVTGVKEGVVASIRPALRVFAAAVGVVLVIVCANVANLLLARGTARQRELAMRLAIGAGRGRIVRQLMTESLVLAVLGGALGALTGVGGIALVKSLATVEAPGIFQLAFGGDILPRLRELHITPGVFAIAFGLAALTSLIFGCIPAIRLSRLDQLHALGARTVTGGDSRLRGMLVVGQLAMATVLLIGAGLLGHGFVKLATVQTGYDPTNVLAFQLVLPADYSIARKTETVTALLSRLRTVPRIENAGFSYAGPLVGIVLMAGYFVPPGRTEEEMRPDVRPQPHIRSVSSDFLTSIGVRLLDGRMLSERDDAGAPLAVLVNRSAARHLFGEASPVGSVMAWHGRNVTPVQVEVVGVVDDVRMGRLDQEATPQVFVDYRQLLTVQQRWNVNVPVQDAIVLGSMSFAVRTSTEPAALTAAVASTIAAVDANAGVDAIAPMDQLVSTSIARPRFYAVVLGIFAAIAGLLAAVGVYGVLAYTVLQRTQEIGVRMALGAERRSVLALILRKGLTLTTIGIVIGLCGAAGATRLLQSLLYGVTPLDGWTFAAVATAFAAVAALASYLPARRATYVDPVVALRCD